MLDDKRLRELRRRAGRCEGRIPCQIRPLELMALVEEVIDSREKIKVLEWTPITLDNLPNIGDEVGDGLRVRTVTNEFVDLSVVGWESGGWTHFRSINASQIQPALPSPSSLQSQPALSLSED